MRFFSIVVALMFLASCGGGSPVVENPPSDNPPVDNPPEVNLPEELAITASISSTTEDALEVVVTGGTAPYTVRITEPGGLIADATEFTTEDGTAVFKFSPIDPVYGGGGLCFISAEDSLGQTRQTDEYILYEEMQLNDDTLYAIPTKHVVKVGEPVTIMVATGATAHSFQFVLGIGVVLDDDVRLNDGGYNIGAIGGYWFEADGVWSDITADSGFAAVGPDSFLFSGKDPDGSLPPGTLRYDISIAPLQVGRDPTTMDKPSVKGALFNLPVTYTTPGEKHVGFQEFNGINRTYYSNATDAIDRSWSVLMADETGTLHESVVGQVDNTILVTE